MRLGSALYSFAIKSTTYITSISARAKSSAGGGARGVPPPRRPPPARPAAAPAALPRHLHHRIRDVPAAHARCVRVIAGDRRDDVAARFGGFRECRVVHRPLKRRSGWLIRTVSDHDERQPRIGVPLCRDVDVIRNTLACAGEHVGTILLALRLILRALRIGSRSWSLR